MYEYQLWQSSNHLIIDIYYMNELIHKEKYSFPKTNHYYKYLYDLIKLIIKLSKSYPISRININNNVDKEILKSVIKIYNKSVVVT